MHKRAITLLELLLAISLLGVVALGMASLDIFSRYYLRSIERSSLVQNELAYVLDHMAKIIGVGVFGGAIGDLNNPPLKIYRVPNEGWILKVFIDKNRNGRKDPEPQDMWVAYQLRVYDQPQYQLWFWHPCVGDTCNGGGSSYSVLSKRIKGCCQEYEGNGELALRFAMNTGDPNNPYDPTKNYVDIRLGGCYDPFQRESPCGSPENPKVYMYTRIRMPAVSTH
jgi:hypothetical protein